MPRQIERPIRELSTREQECLDAVKAYIADHGFSPSQDELGAKMHVTRQMVTKYLSRLEGKGHIAIAPGSHRAIEVLKR